MNIWLHNKKMIPLFFPRVDCILKEIDKPIWKTTENPLGSGFLVFAIRKSLFGDDFLE